MNEEKIMSEEKFEVGCRYLVKDARHPIMSPINEIIVQELTDKYIKVQHKPNNVISWYEISDFIILEKLSNGASLIRNCDVGTVREQKERFDNYCESIECNKCPAYFDKSIDCGIWWSQMEYEKEINNGS